MAYLTPHFSYEELTASDAAVRLNIDNTPDYHALSNLHILAAGLERIRDVLGTPILISSGYRSPTLNMTIGGGKTSRHMLGLAADFRSPKFGPPIDIVKAIDAKKDVVKFDQLILEFGAWVHVSFTRDPDEQPRGQVLTAVRDGITGVMYLKGVFSV
jgi:hypothetical protein